MNKYKLEDLKNNNFSLVLSGGSAKGYAHIGIIKFLDENNLKPKEIIGTSMGSIISACYAIGKTDKEIIDKLKDTSFLKLFSIKYGNGGMRNQKIYELFDNFFKGKKMKDTKIDLKICATNFETGKARVFTRKDDIKIVDAVMASISIPGIFSPVDIEKHTYVDGFLSSDLPIEFADDENLKLAVNVQNSKGIKNVKGRTAKKHFFKTKAIMRNINMTFMWMIINQTRDKLKHIKNYILIEPNLSEFKKSQFDKFEEMSYIGYQEIKNYFN